MLRPHKITFYRMMLAGYLSAESYCALKPKKQIGELSFSDCFEFETEVCSELKSLFEDENLKERLYYLENIEDSINLEWDNIHKLLNLCVYNLREELLNVFHAIGERTFAMDYVFCSDDCFKELNYINEYNYDALNQVRNQFAVLYKDYLNSGAFPEISTYHHVFSEAYTDIVPKDTFMVSESFGEYSIASGRGFSGKDNFVIDDDALGIDNSACRKYVLYLYSLDSEQFEKFQNYLSFIISKSSVRLSNAIVSIGYRNFLVNFLFADDTKFYQIRNFGKKTLADFNSMKPHIISFVVNEYNAADTGAIEREIQKEREEISYESPTLKEKESNEVKAYTDIVPKDTFMVSEPFGGYSIASGRGFSGKDNFVIDDDALGINNSACRKYVLYLYSLDSDQFEKFQSYLSSIISKSSARLNNAIKYSIGYRNFLVNFLFADDTKFYQIRNFGKKTLADFNSIKPHIISFVVNEYNEADTGTIEKRIQKEEGKINYESLTLREKVGEVQYALLTNLLKSLMAGVGVRTQNGIINYKGDFIEDFVHKSNDVKTLRNIGVKSEIEFHSIISQLRDAIDSLEQRELTEEENFLNEKTLVYDRLIDDYCCSYYKSKGHLPMFHLLANCVSFLLEDRSVKILNDVIPLISDDEGSELIKVAKEHDLHPERIRQICRKTINSLSMMCNPEVSNIPLFHKLLGQKEDWDYVSKILSEKDLWEIKELRVLLQNEKCSISINLVLVVLSVIFSDQYVIVGKAPLSVSSRSNGWSNTYFISKRFTDNFDFDVMIDIVKDYESSNTESTTFTIKELVMDTFYGAWKQYDFSIEEDLEYVVGEILVDELGIIPDLEFNYTLEGKKEENPADVLYNLLKESGNPLSLEELYCQLKLTIPNKYRSANSLRIIITEDPRLCFLGAGKMVALSEWKHIRTGSIRELIASYLAEFDTPQHLGEIVAYIQKHRNTTERSISSTMGSGNQFVRFAGGFYGLTDRSYPDWFYLSEAERFSRDRIIDFEKFIQENRRFPFRPSDDKEEESLYQWWSRTKGNRDISDILKQEINRIETIYSYLPKNKSDYLWLTLCHRYRDYVLANGRKPSERTPIESELAKWFSKAWDDINEGKLSPLREREFIELCKSL